MKISVSTLKVLALINTKSLTEAGSCLSQVGSLLNAGSWLRAHRLLEKSKLNGHVNQKARYDLNLLGIVERFCVFI